MFSVPAANISRLREKVEALNRRAPRLGADPIKLVIGEAFAKMFYTEILGEPYQRWYYPVEIAGERPSLNGWTFMAKIEPHGDGVNMVKLLPGVESVPTRYRATDMTCDHCGTNRYRNETFLVQHKDGTYKQVGRNCLADFLGGSSPEALARRAEWLAQAVALGDEDYEDFIGGTAARPCVDTVAFLTLVEATARTFGFIKRSEQDKGQPTADEVWSYMNNLMTESQRDFFAAKVIDGITARDVATAEKVIAWAREQRESRNDFLYNLSVAAMGETVDERAIGLLAAAIPAYYRAMQQEREQASRPASQHAGTVGQRSEFTVTVTAVRHFESDYGALSYISMIDPEGNDLLWKTGRCPVWAEEGQTLTVKATVKEFGEFRGRKQTLVNRVTAV